MEKWKYKHLNWCTEEHAVSRMAGRVKQGGGGGGGAGVDEGELGDNVRQQRRKGDFKKMHGHLR